MPTYEKVSVKQQLENRAKAKVAKHGQYQVACGQGGCTRKILGVPKSPIFRILHGVVTPAENRGVTLRKKIFFPRDFGMAQSDENERARGCARAAPSLPGVLSTAIHRLEDESSMTRKETA